MHGTNPSKPSERASGTSDAERRVRAVVVAPTFNNDAALANVLERISATGMTAIVVNDGSTDNTADILEKWHRQDEPHRLVERHAVNRGKAAALATGFRRARQLGFTHAITIDTDGQLAPEQLQRFADAAEKNPCALVLGERNPDECDVPASRRLGWWMTALGLWLETGRHIGDSQCGYRAYPLASFDVVRCGAGRFAFESEVITRALWAGCPLVRVPVSCHYPPPGEGCSHYKTFLDSVYIFLLHALLAIRRLVPIPHRKIPGAREGDSKDPAALRRRVLANLSPIELWRRARRDRFEQLLIATSAAMGTFMAALPMGGLNWLVAGYAGTRLYINALPAIAFGLLGLTPVGEALRGLGMFLGYGLTHLSAPSEQALALATSGDWRAWTTYPVSTALGCITIAFLAHWIVTPLAVRALRLVPLTPDAARKRAARSPGAVPSVARGQTAAPASADAPRTREA